LKKCTNEEFIQKAVKIHGSKYPCLDTYKGAHVQLRFQCVVHGEFLLTPDQHINTKRGCPKCGRQISHNKKRGSIEDLQYIAYLRHGKCLSSIYIDSPTKYTWQCSNKHVWEASAVNIQNGGTWCPYCAIQSSKGEREIERVLIKYGLKFNIDYFREHSFKECKNKKLLLFDFYIPNKNLVIEFDGQQHFKPISLFGGNKAFTTNLANDIIKDTFCALHRIKLIRIPYWDLKNIESILDTKLKPNHIVFTMSYNKLLRA